MPSGSCLVSPTTKSFGTAPSSLAPDTVTARPLSRDRSAGAFPAKSVCSHPFPLPLGPARNDHGKPDCTEQPADPESHKEGNEAPFNFELVLIDEVATDPEPDPANKHQGAANYPGDHRPDRDPPCAHTIPIHLLIIPHQSYADSEGESEITRTTITERSTMITSSIPRSKPGRLCIAAGTAVTCAALVFAPSAAFANSLSESDPTPPIQVEPIDPTDPVIHPDGTITGGDSTILGTDRCGSTASFPPLGGYGPISQATCSFWGSPGAQAGYTWSVNPFSRSEACVSGLGYNGAKSPVYFGVGCGKSGGKNVAWGNVAGYQKLKAYATGLLTGGLIAWH